MMTNVLILPGIYNSGPQHWQSLWEAAHPEYRRVQQKDWETPLKDDWVAAVDAAIRAVNDDALLIAHSLGCITIAHWAREHNRPIHGALLVAPPDLDARRPNPDPWGFAPVPLVPFNFPSIVVASSDDRGATIERAEFFARSWGSRFVNIGAHGHINVDAGFGPWPEGERLLAELINGDRDNRGKSGIHQ